MLVCEVAHGQIPRLERAGKHRRVAAWLESLAAERSELLAHHYGRALELASAAGQATGDLADRALLALRDAAIGSRAGRVRHRRPLLHHNRVAPH